MQSLKTNVCCQRLKVEDVLAVKGLTAPIFLKHSNFGTKGDTTAKLDQIDRSLAVSYRAFLTFLSPFQSYGGLKKLERSIFFWLPVPIQAFCQTLELLTLGFKCIKCSIRVPKVKITSFSKIPLSTVSHDKRKGMSIDPTAPFKCVRLGSVRSSHLAFKMHYVGLRAFKSPYINACRVNSNTKKKVLLLTQHALI